MVGVARVKALPISREEFARFFRKSIGNSGGSDSTCLMFLINRYIGDMHPNSPTEGLSLTVDHALQDSSAAMAQHCADHAEAMGVPHLTSRVPWGEHPFPERPKTGEAFEEIARAVRYQVLFQAMHKSQINILALGHHMDDQVETSLMRLARGTTELGAGGMRRCRRWGMGTNGDENTLSWSGAEGMKKWMVRPLLEVPKDRILATCEEHNIEYVTDHTNFQPELTLRNAIRYMLSKNTFDAKSLGLNLPFHIADGLEKIRTDISGLESVDMDLSDGIENLRSAVTVLSEQLEDIDSLVDSSLNRCHLPSPVGTYMVSYRGLATVRDPLVKAALILRIMRYASFHAWGTVRADGNRRKASIAQIIAKLWIPDPFAAKIPPFVAGGGVFWTPFLVGPGSMRMNTTGRTKPGEIVAWVASRQPPLSPARLRDMGVANPMQVDLTQKITAALRSRGEKPGQVLDVLWDCRFMLTIKVDKIPDHIASGILEGADQVWVHPNTRWYWPKVVHRKPGHLATDTVVHSTISTQQQGVVPLDRDTMASLAYMQIEEVTSDWIQIEWIRSLSAL
ncbi:PP-loop family-domain-containing protein [Mycena vulgaris]|nr:PP-loop family-domain-containing protein [Mycena vulgaris]